MIVDVKTMYQFYNDEIDIRIDKVKAELDYQKGNRDILEKELFRNKRIIENYLSISYDDVLALVNYKDSKTIKYPIIAVFFEGKRINFTAIKLYIDNYTIVNRAVKQLKERLTNLKDNKVSEDIFRFIFKKGNSLIIDKIVYENYTFTPLATFGSIGITANSSNKKRVNWGESDKKKEEILARGGTPFSKDNPDGEKWMIYHEGLDFFINWNRSYSARTYNPILNDYAYKPARGNFGIVSKFNKVKKDKEKAKQLYHE